MKSTPLILLSLAVTGLAAPAFCEVAAPRFEIPADVPQPVQTVMADVNGVVAGLHRAEAVLRSVKDKATADAAADVLKREIHEVCRLREECMDIFAANQDLFPTETDPFTGEVKMSDLVVKIEEAIGEAVEPCMEAAGECEGPDGDFYGSTALSAVLRLFSDVFEWGMTEEESSIMPGVVEVYMEYNAVCTEAWESIASVQDRASAEAAAAKLAVLRDRSDAVTDRLKSMLDTLRHDRLPGFCEQGTAFALQSMGSAERERMEQAKSEARSKMEELQGMEPPFFGSKELEENAGAFVIQPR